MYYFTNADGQSVCMTHAELEALKHGQESIACVTGIQIGGTRLDMTHTTFSSDHKPKPMHNVVEYNTAYLYQWILSTAAHARKHAVLEVHESSGEERWSDYGMFVRATDFICRDIRMLTDSKMLCEVDNQVPVVIVHSDGTSLSFNRFGRHIDLEGRVRTKQATLGVVHGTMNVLTQECHQMFGSVIVLILDTRACELWYCRVFEEFFSRHYVLIKIYFADVSRKSLCDPEDVEATNLKYARMLAAMPPIHNVTDVTFRTDASRVVHGSAVLKAAHADSRTLLDLLGG
jgi:hypothetical protein